MMVHTPTAMGNTVELWPGELYPWGRAGGGEISTARAPYRTVCITTTSTNLVCGICA